MNFRVDGQFMKVIRVKSVNRIEKCKACITCINKKIKDYKNVNYNLCFKVNLSLERRIPDDDRFSTCS